MQSYFSYEENESANIRILGIGEYEIRKCENTKYETCRQAGRCGNAEMRCLDDEGSTRAHLITVSIH
jgi:hypothetical protein